MTSILLVLIAIALIGSCSEEKYLTVSHQKLIRDDVTRTLHQYYGDISRFGLMAELKYLDDSPEFFWVPPGYKCSIAYDSVINILTKNAPGYRMVNNKFRTLKVFPLTNQFASYTASIESKITDTAGTESTHSLLETGLMIRRPDGWKLLQGQTCILNH